MVKPWLMLWMMPVLLGALPVIERPVTDPDRVLSAPQTQTVSAELVRLRADTGTQMAVLLVGSTEGEPIEDYSMRVAQAWRGGKAGEDKGLLLVVALKDRRMRLDVGYGLEAELPDDAVRRLLDAQRPLMKQQDTAGALLRIVQGVHARLVPEGVLPGPGTSPIAVAEVASVAGKVPVAELAPAEELAPSALSVSEYVSDAELKAFRALILAALCLFLLISVTHHPGLVVQGLGETVRQAVIWGGTGLILGFVIYSAWGPKMHTGELLFAFCGLCTVLLVGRRLLFAGGHARWGLAMILGSLLGGFSASSDAAPHIFEQIWNATQLSLGIGFVVLIATFHDFSNAVFSAVIFVLTGKKGYEAWRRAPSQQFTFTSSSGSSSRSSSGSFSSSSSSSSGGSWGGGGGGFGGGGASSSW